MKKIICLLMVFAVMMAQPIFGSAEDYDKAGYYESMFLNELGLYNGIGTKEFNPDLSTVLDRQTGIVFFLRIIGKDDEAKKYSKEQIANTLSKFKDQKNVASWASASIAYAIDKGYVKGVTVDTIGPLNKLSVDAFASLILRSAGYNVAYEEAKKTLLEQANAYVEFQDPSLKQLNKGEMCAMSLYALKIKEKGKENTLFDRLLVEKKVKLDATNETVITYELTNEAQNKIHRLDQIRFDFGIFAQGEYSNTKIMTEYMGAGTTVKTVKYLGQDAYELTSPKGILQYIYNDSEAIAFVYKFDYKPEGVTSNFKIANMTYDQVTEQLSLVKCTVEDITTSEQKSTGTKVVKYIQRKELHDDYIHMTITFKNDKVEKVSLELFE